VITQGRSIVCVGFAEWDAEVWTNQQHLMSRLAAHNKVLFVESLGLRRPQFVARDLRRIGRRLIRGLAGPRLRNGVLVLSPLVLPFHGNAFVRMLNRWILQFLVKRTVRRARMEQPLLWAYVPQAEILVPTLNPATVIYHCVDDLAEQKGIDAGSFRAAEHRFVERADLVIVSAPRLATRLSRRARRILHAPNVADTALFAEALQPGEIDPAVAALPCPRIVFTGAVVSTKLDMDLIIHVARRHPEWSIILAGPVGLGDPTTDVTALAAIPNIHLIGPRPHDGLVPIVRGAQVGIIPYALNPLTVSVYPMKVFEYLAAGLPVVTTALPSLERNDAVTVAFDSEGFVTALERALLSDDRKARLARSERARSHSWDTRLREIDDAIRTAEEAKPTRTIVATPYPPTVRSGTGRRTVGVIAALAARGHVDVVYQETDDGPSAHAFEQQPTVRLHPVKGSRGVRRIATYIAARAFGAPASFGRGVWPELADQVRRLADDRCQVVADGPIAATALRRDMRRRAVIYNAHNLESGFRHLVYDKGFGSQPAIRRFERRILERCAEAWLVSEIDLQGAAELAPNAGMLRVPNVIDMADIPPTRPFINRTAILVGDFTYEPNRRALEFVVNEVSPAVAARDPDVRIVVAGRGSDSMYPPMNVHLRGFVESMTDVYESAGCAIVPLQCGGGSPVKFIEALAHGVPVVATAKAAAGIDGLIANEHYILAELTGEAFAEGILDALEPLTAERLGPAGRAFAQRGYSLDALIRILAEPASHAPVRPGTHAMEAPWPSH
jgi:glycosyltransferase involved in cell wall biosynthesis